MKLALAAVTFLALCSLALVGLAWAFELLLEGVGG